MRRIDSASRPGRIVRKPNVPRSRLALISVSPSTLRRAAAKLIFLPQKAIFNLRVHAMQPLLGALGSFLIGRDFRFQLRYPIFSRAKLTRKLLRRLQRLSAAFFGNTGRPVQHLQNRLACFVELIIAVRRRRPFSPRKRYHFRRGIITTDLTVHCSSSYSTFSTQIVRIVMIVARRAFCTSSNVSMGCQWDVSVDLLRMSNTAS
jgi:hypothetical protein